MDLSEWRAKIDDVDRRILDLLEKRASYVLGVVGEKIKDGAPIRDLGREAAIQEQLLREVRRRAASDSKLTEDGVSRIFQAVFDVMCDIQEAERERLADRVESGPEGR